ncbi:hypothetical protein L228DRAFT_242909 [Xylona heveae TC161]|uniref:Guanine nucleotide exchange factor Vps9 n=1 Tax=Xylona heveae (strain CBS 132557 / TC161) TaxID=1328760 RepID=A0A165JMT8_XYLHT|nr:hypothetical protein L228DRAFT_242909 [Xylona heveae TC161]KZF26433.1 hypothetical protein L228DRAFT_242909 [Xylona heveae TC161]
MSSSTPEPAISSQLPADNDRRQPQAGSEVDDQAKELIGTEDGAAANPSSAEDGANSATKSLTFSQTDNQVGSSTRADDVKINATPLHTEDNGTSEETAGAGNVDLAVPTAKLTISEGDAEASSEAIPDTNMPRPIVTSPSPPPPPPKDEVYLDPTPKTPLPSKPPSRADSYSSKSLSHGKGKEIDNDERNNVEHRSDSSSEDEKQAGSGESDTEIQSIIEQFKGNLENSNTDAKLDPRVKFANHMAGSPPPFPPRRSSLEPPPGGVDNNAIPNEGRLSEKDSDVAPAVPPKPSDYAAYKSVASAEGQPLPGSPTSHKSHHQAPPPAPDPEPALPFDFQRFLEQLRHRTADPIAKYLRSFLLEFGKKQWMVHEQIKIISDFLAFITNKMAHCEVWRGVSDAEFDNAKEGMEKLVMNRLYSQTFSPAIPPPQPIPGAKAKRRGDVVLGPGRRGQHQEDVERDEVLAQKVQIYGWVREQHLDIKPVGPGGRKFLTLAQQELLKIKNYRAPRDKVICILNCCKVIFGLLRHAKSDQSADSFVPLLIYVVLQANPEHLVSNVQYILRFRDQDKLSGEAGYYISSLMGAIQFIENLDRTNLTVSDDEFEKHVEVAVSAIAEKNRKDEAQIVPSQGRVPEKSALSQPEVTPRSSSSIERSDPRRAAASSDAIAVPIDGDGTEDNDAVTGLLRTIQKPLSTIGRIFSEDNVVSQPPNAGNQRGYPGIASQLKRAPESSPELQTASGEARRPTREEVRQTRERSRLRAEDAAARQASAEAAEAQRIQRAEHNDVVETLAGMFPDLDKEVIDDVVRLKEGRVGLAVDACLALSS